MVRSGPEVADVFRRYGDAYSEQHDASLHRAQRHVVTAIELCRTAVLGGHPALVVEPLCEWPKLGLKRTLT